ncbi:MAG: DUF1549 domain-containing protein, partial [Pirellulaceae bacterium]|nr:DUF1549 domain-containing protein [Pirellulaceae bacterium]
MIDWLRRAALGLWAAAALAPLAECAEVDYLRDVKPIFSQRCIACHGALQQQSGLRLDAGALILRGGDGGPVVTAGDADRSPLLERVASADLDLRMPPEGEPLSDAQIQTLRAWIGQGARFPDDERPEEDPRRHWAFQVLRRPAVPATAGPSAVTGHPIDAFLAARRADSHLDPQPAAPQGLLLRRVYLDLIGLPPSRDELRAFLADPSPDAYERVVDRLLASPRYGERWGRHWMDVWRYSDWYGRRMVPDVWNSAPQIWRWRDWIVQSLNGDRGYDQMVAEMLAGDEVAPDDDQAGYATGYLVRNWYALNPNDWMRSNVEHTGKAFLGLTLNCAHCHDHKYDPITQDDYFRFRAFFEPIGIRQDRVPGEADPGPFQEYQYSTLRKIVRLGGVRIFDKTPDAPTWFYTGGDERNRVAERGSMAAGVPRFLEQGPLDLEPVSLPLTAWKPSLRPAIQETLLAEQQEQVSAARQQLASVRGAADARLPELRRALDEAEAEHQRAAALAPEAQRQGPLAGRQSLLLRAEQGRCLVQNRLRGLRQLPAGTTIGFQLRILRDAHVNFQLAKDLEQGLTAGFVSFEAGVIKSYQPGSFNEFEVGRYDLAGGQTQFEVSLELQPADDRCRLTVRLLSDPPAVLVDQVPVALNGWNPVENPLQAVTFDARTGSVVLIDELSVEAPPATGDAATAGNGPWVRIGFEPPEYAQGSDVVGSAGWESSRFSQAPATARVGAASDLAPPSPASLRVQSARRAVELEELRIAAAEA